MIIYGSRLLSFASECMEYVRLVMPKYSSKYSRKDFTQHQLATLVCLMRKYKPKYRDFTEMLQVMDGLKEFLGLGKTPHFTTLDKFFLRMKGVMLGMLMELSIGESSGDASVDSTCLDRRHASKHYVKRSKMRLKALKSTLLVDTETQKVLGIHNTTTRRHDSKIVMPVARKAGKKRRIKSIRGDCGYDDRKVREALRRMGIRPLIKHREFTGRQKVWNSMMDREEYGQRWKSETANSVIKRRYGDYVASAKWWSQFKEMMLMAFVYNVDVELRKSCFWIGGFLRSKNSLICWLKKR